jgi:hypothetical protein
MDMQDSELKNLINTLSKKRKARIENQFLKIDGAIEQIKKNLFPLQGMDKLIPLQLIAIKHYTSLLRSGSIQIEELYKELEVFIHSIEEIPEAMLRNVCSSFNQNLSDEGNNGLAAIIAKLHKVSSKTVYNKCETFKESYGEIDDIEMAEYLLGSSLIDTDINRTLSFIKTELSKRYKDDIGSC